jgi:two-component system nitrate/nitrite response regulator NarL
MNVKAGAIVVADGAKRSRALVVGSLRRAGHTTVEARTGAEALEAGRAKGVALVLLEVVLPDMTGYEVCRDLRRRSGGRVPIFLMSELHADPLNRVAGLLLGADDFIVRPFDQSELVARVERFVSPRSDDPAVEKPPAWAGGGHGLTRREHEVLELLAGGRRQTEIAGVLSVSPKTVGTHIQNVLTKVGAHSRAELVARAYQLGLVDPG